MNKQWRTYADKIDALAPRERTIVLIGAVAVVVIVMTLLYIDPALTRQKTLSRNMAQQQNELQVLQAQTQGLEQQRTGPEAANLARRESLKRQITQIDATLNDMRKNLVAAEDMKTLLQNMLTRNTRLHLIAMRTLPVTPLVDRHEPAQKSDAPSASRATPAPSESSVFKHGVEITLEGSYVELHDYLANLEKQPWRMFWSRASLNAEDYPRLTLTITVYTLSLDKAWLVV